MATFRVMFSNGVETSIEAPSFHSACIRSMEVARQAQYDDAVPVMMTRVPTDGPYPAYVKERLDKYAEAVSGINEAARNRLVKAPEGKVNG